MHIYRFRDILTASAGEHRMVEDGDRMVKIVINIASQYIVYHSPR